MSTFTLKGREQNDPHKKKQQHKILPSLNLQKPMYELKPAKLTFRITKSVVPSTVPCVVPF